MLYIAEIEVPAVEDGIIRNRAQVYMTEANTGAAAQRDFDLLVEELRRNVKLGAVRLAGRNERVTFGADKSGVTPGAEGATGGDAPESIQTYLDRLDKLRTLVRQRQAADNLLTMREAALTLHCTLAEVWKMAEDANLNVNIGGQVGSKAFVNKNQGDNTLEDLSV